jgi:hypothetical protein
MDVVDGELNPMADAEAQLYRRIKELRARARGAEPTQLPVAAQSAEAPVPDLRTLLARAENHVDELRATAASLEQSLPVRVERAVERALDSHDSSRRSAELRDLLLELTGRVDQVNKDLLAERLGRVEDLELVVELLSAGIAAVRQDVAGMRSEVGSIGMGVDSVITKLDQPIQVTLERSRQGGVRDLFRPTDAPAADEAEHESSSSPGTPA